MKKKAVIIMTTNVIAAMIMKAVTATAPAGLYTSSPIPVMDAADGIIVVIKGRLTPAGFPAGEYWHI